jgi:PTH1 family peptidyl-tRNA hydrolase
MKFIIGIGNTGEEYEGTRHNIGFTVVGAIKDRGSYPKWNFKKRFNAWVAELLGNVWLVRSTLFVNNTAGTISALRENTPFVLPQDYLVVCDDVNLEFGKMRLRASGSAGGHHGLESVIQALGTEEFPRLRIGVGSENMPKNDLTNFVLGHFTPEEKNALEMVLGKAASVCDSWIKDGFDGATNRLSRLQSIVEEK